MKDKNEVKPCPFCGAELKFVNYYNHNFKSDMGYLHPNNGCYLGSDSRTPEFVFNDRTSIERWNTRVTINKKDG